MTDKAEVKHLKIAEFLEARKFDPSSIIVDVRDDEKWNEGHIPGALHLQKSEVESKIRERVPDLTAKIICHCGGGTSGAKAAETLVNLGYENVAVLDGGFRSYKAHGAPIQK
ncbi:MAG: rhodanese-like domain-containing protein [Ignavibacteriota bacterium]